MVFFEAFTPRQVRKSIRFEVLRRFATKNIAQLVENKPRFLNVYDCFHSLLSFSQTFKKKLRNIFGHYIRSYDGSYISNYVKIMSVCGIFRVLLNSLVDRLIELNENISCKHVKIEF